MKKFLCGFLVIFAAMLFAGCTPTGPEHQRQQYPWQVIMVMQFQLSNTSATQESIDALKESLEISEVNLYDNNILQLVFSFDNYSDFAKYFNASGKNTVTVETKEKAFFYERMIYFINPWAAIRGSDKVNSIISNVVLRFSLTSSEPENFYIFRSTYRRTEVKNTETVQRPAADYYDYVFSSETKELTVFDLSANTPLWYLSAVGGTALVILSVYIVFAKRKKTR